MTLESRTEQERSKGHWHAYIVFASLLAALAISSLGRPDITNVEVDLPTTPIQQRTYVGLPYSRASDADSVTFRVKAVIWRSAVSSDRVRITPDDCLEAITINGVDVPQVKAAKPSWRCFPSNYSQYLQLGANAVELALTDKGGLYGINIVGLYSQAAVLAMVAYAGIALYAGAFALLAAAPELLALFSSVIGRMCVMSFLPCLGLFAMWATIANGQTDWPQDHIVTTLVAVIIPFALLMRLLDESGGKPLRLSLSYPPAAVSLATVAYASMLLADRGWSSDEIQAIAAVGVIAGFFASVPLRAFVKRLRHFPRALAVTMVAALAPHAFWELRVSSWNYLSGVTTAMVRGILWACGFPTSTFTWEQKGKDGQMTEYWATVISSDFSVKIGSWCSGFEGITLFIFLLSCFVLLDWKLFSKVKRLWAIYVLTVPFMLIVNALRISGLFLYAEWNVWWYNRNTATWATVEAFHSNIGWVMYSVAFALFLPLVYRWARRAAKVK